jgi:peptidoglycan/xylan/chitin deacetylase (PgdA/CDA1 family)
MRKILRNIFYAVCAFFDYVIKERNAHILMYHSFSGDLFFSVSRENFERQIQYLRKRNYIFTNLHGLIDRMNKEQSIKKHVVISIDDGHQDFKDVALPIIEKYNIPVTLFWPTGMPDSILRLSTGENCSILSKKDIMDIAGHPLVELGSHSVSHQELPFITTEALHHELIDSFLEIKELTRGDVSFAYPRGKFNDVVKKSTSLCGYYCACTVIPGVVTPTSDRYALSRISIDRETSMLAFKAKLSWLFKLYAIVRP